VFPHSSVAVQVRVIVSVLPQLAAEASLKVIATVPQVSAPVAVPVAAGSVGSVHSTVASAGKVNDGGVVSTTVIVWSKDVAFPHASVAVQVRVIVSVLPQLAADTSLKVIATVPQVSAPVAEPVAAGSVGSVHSTVTSAGNVNEGGVVSTTVIIWSADVVFPH